MEHVQSGFGKPDMTKLAGTSQQLGQLSDPTQLSMLQNLLQAALSEGNGMHAANGKNMVETLARMLSGGGASPNVTDLQGKDTTANIAGMSEQSISQSMNDFSKSGKTNSPALNKIARSPLFKHLSSNGDMTQPGKVQIPSQVQPPLLKPVPSLKLAGKDQDESSIKSKNSPEPVSVTAKRNGHGHAHNLMALLSSGPSHQIKESIDGSLMQIEDNPSNGDNGNLLEKSLKAVKNGKNRLSKQPANTSSPSLTNKAQSNGHRNGITTLSKESLPTQQLLNKISETKSLAEVTPAELNPEGETPADVSMMDQKAQSKSLFARQKEEVGEGDGPDVVMTESNDEKVPVMEDILEMKENRGGDGTQSPQLDYTLKKEFFDSIKLKIEGQGMGQGTQRHGSYQSNGEQNATSESEVNKPRSINTDDRFSLSGKPDTEEQKDMSEQKEIRRKV